MAASKPFTPVEFSALLDEKFACELAGVSRVAVGVSGGPDSMALAWLVSGWAKERKVTVHALTVDHGLRVGSAREAEGVMKAVQGWPQIKHEILKWKGRKPKTRILEEARKARFGLMAEYCRAHKIKYLFLAHHQDDQAETFLLRLAGGSGLDGLAGMRAAQVYENVVLLRPFLGVSKERLVATCQKNKIPYVEDPTNLSTSHARPRLRKSMAVLEAEGMSAKRLAVTASRLGQAKEALNEIAGEVFIKAILDKNSKRIVYDYNALWEWPDEIGRRVILLAVKALRPEAEHNPRMEKIESLCADLLRAKVFRKRTLGGLIFERDDKRGQVVISQERKG